MSHCIHAITHCLICPSNKHKNYKRNFSFLKRTAILTYIANLLRCQDTKSHCKRATKIYTTKPFLESFQLDA